MQTLLLSCSASKDAECSLKGHGRQCAQSRKDHHDAMSCLQSRSFIHSFLGRANLDHLTSSLKHIINHLITRFRQVATFFMAQPACDEGSAPALPTRTDHTASAKRTLTGVLHSACDCLPVNMHKLSFLCRCSRTMWQSTTTKQLCCHNQF